ncbi:secreted protein [methanotrophic bacterial endosymbiont of Bathymodiolus sp.]|nr:secreted protein [methanotrophic bacterial endosymbiont of Bathymodiolus sp.]
MNFSANSLATPSCSARCSSLNALIALACSAFHLSRSLLLTSLSL